MAQVCVGGDAGAGTSAPDPANPAGAGGEGDACGSRRECRSGLACVANVCEPASSGMQPGNRYSGRGESCAASNECAEDLACVGGMCVAVTLGLERTTKSCELVECAADADCCSDFTPNANCDAYRQNC